MIDREPNRPDAGLPDVELTIAPMAACDLSIDTPIITLPIDPAPIDPAPIDPAPVEAVLVEAVPFDDFYRARRDQIGRALAVTLRDPQLAAEAVDEAMARAYQRWAQVQRLDNPSGWVYRVGLNWSRSFLRRALRPAPIWVTGPDASPPPAFPDPGIDAALAELSVDQRAVVVCRFLVGCSEAETAAVLGIRPGTVKSRLSRALDRLRVLLHDLDPALADSGAHHRDAKDDPS